MILEKIERKTKERVEENKRVLSLIEIRKQINERKNLYDFPFRKAILEEGLSFICEVKKASPSKGVIVENFLYKEIAREYEEVGAAAVSVLTEPYFFQGKNHYLEEIVKEIKIPVLRKDFVVDEYMIYEAKNIGAHAILLICAILEEKQLKDYLELAKELGLSALTEVHNEEEVEKAIESGAEIIGINNRNLKTFEVDLMNTIRLSEIVPKDKILISESGIQTGNDIGTLKDANIQGVLIGEGFMKTDDKKGFLELLRGEFEK